MFSGFEAINSILQMSSTGADKATTALKDGRVTKVEKAEQGGSYVFVDDEPHYVAQGFEVLVKPGDTVEQGDQLGDGIVNPGDIMAARGVGEARRYYADRLKQVMDDSGFAANRRNTELLARAAVNHVEVGDDGFDGYLPEDVVSYDVAASRYVPPASSKYVKPDESVGKYLQTPALHYTIGTRITPSIARKLNKVGVKSVYASDEEPGFRPAANRLATATGAGDDWLAKQQSSYLKGNLVDDVVRGRDTNVAENAHWAPRLAFGAGFGKNVTAMGHCGYKTALVRKNEGRR